MSFSKEAYYSGKIEIILENLLKRNNFKLFTRIFFENIEMIEKKDYWWIPFYIEISIRDSKNFVFKYGSF